MGNRYSILKFNEHLILWINSSTKSTKILVFNKTVYYYIGPLVCRERHVVWVQSHLLNIIFWLYNDGNGILGQTINAYILKKCGWQKRDFFLLSAKVQCKQSGKYRVMCLLLVWRIFYFHFHFMQTWWKHQLH